MEIAQTDYQRILAKVQEKIRETEKKIVQTVTRQKVEMCWQIGEIIEEHLLKNDRAEYGQNFFKQLAKDTSISERTLYEMRSFRKAYPELPKDDSSLNWSHYRSLASIKNVERRRQLEKLAKSKNLDSEKLRQEISKSKPRPQKNQTTKLKFTRGQLLTHTLNEDGEIDLGFNIFLVSDKKISAVNKSDYTYAATLERVVDGDTIHVKLDLGFGVKHHEILRLAKIDAAAADTVEGKKATEGLKKILKDVKFLIVKTNKTDIYGRYIADVFFDPNESDPNKVAAEGRYLNQALLDSGLVGVY
jgi:endonuclease YncB( thermonuclease family)